MCRCVYIDVGQCFGLYAECAVFKGGAGIFSLAFGRACRLLGNLGSDCNCLCFRMIRIMGTDTGRCDGDTVDGFGAGLGGDSDACETRHKTR